VDARCIDGEPDGAAYDHVDRYAAHAYSCHRKYDCDTDARRYQRLPDNLVAVADGDDQYCSNVIDDRQ
jgi:hypothetical protein